MGNMPALITHNQRVIDQLALENLSKIEEKKNQRERNLVLDYLRKKLTHIANLVDDSVIDRMGRDELELALKKAKVRRYWIFSFKIMWLLLLIAGFATGIVLMKNDVPVGALIFGVSFAALGFLIFLYFGRDSSY